MQRLSTGSASHLVRSLAWPTGLAIVGLVASALVEPYYAFIAAIGLVYGILALTLDLQWGYTGILNLGAAAPFGLGAYIYAAGTVHYHAPVAMALVLAGIAPGVLNWIIAYAAFRRQTSQLYFGLFTLSMTLVSYKVVIVATEVTGGANGLINIPNVTRLANPFLSFMDPLLATWFLVVTITFVVFIVCRYVVVTTRVGILMRAAKDDELRLQTLGYKVWTIKAHVTGVASVLAGWAGATYVSMQGIVDPSLLNPLLSAQVFVWVALGGAGTLTGPLLAALLLGLGQAYLSGTSYEWYLVIIGILFVIAMIVVPQGVMGAVRDGTVRRSLVRILTRFRNPLPGVSADPPTMS